MEFGSDSDDVNVIPQQQTHFNSARGKNRNSMGLKRGSMQPPEV